jgi:hypothetical protein
MVELFQVTPQNVTLNLKAIFAEGELVEGQPVRITYKLDSKGNERCYASTGASASGSL